MRILVIGQTGQLSRCLQEEAKKQGLALCAVSSTDCDVTDIDSLSAWLWPRTGKPIPDAIINTAAFHDLRACEEDFDQAFRVNALGVANLLDAMPPDCHLYTISTDYVFDGADDPHEPKPAPAWRHCSVQRGRPYTTNSQPHPLNNYGRTKRAAELICAESSRATVIRTSSLFSHHGSTGKGGSNFLLGMLKKAKGEDPNRPRNIHVDEDVMMTPTYTPWLARAILHLVKHGMRGGFGEKASGESLHHGGFGRPSMIHLVCDGPPVSWFDFAKAIFEYGGYDEALKRLAPKQSDDYPPRPKYSALEPDRQIRLGTWESALQEYFTAIQKGPAT